MSRDPKLSVYAAFDVFARVIASPAPRGDWAYIRLRNRWTRSARKDLRQSIGAGRGDRVLGGQQLHHRGRPAFGKIHVRGQPADIVGVPDHIHLHLGVRLQHLDHFVQRGGRLWFHHVPARIEQNPAHYNVTVAG